MSLDDARYSELLYLIGLARRGMGGGSPMGDPNAVAFFDPAGTLSDNPKFIVDNSDPNNVRVFINNAGPVGGSGSGMQYSSTVSGRAALRLSQYGNNAGVQNVGFFKSRGATVGALGALVVGDSILNLTGSGVTGNGLLVPIAAIFDAIIPAGGVFAQSLSPDFRWQLARDFVNSRREVWRMVGLTGDFVMKNAGQRIQIKEGANAMQGVASIAAGPVTIANTLITANTRISLTWQDGAGVPSGTPYVVSRVVGASFTIQSTAVEAGVNVFWQLWEPAP